MNLVNKTMVTLVTGVMLTTSVAHATGGQPYIGFKVGQFHIDSNDSEVDIDNPTAYGVYAGYSFVHSFGMEAEYITSDESDFTVKGNIRSITRDFNANTAGIYATYHQQLPNELNKLYVKGKLGLARTEIEIETEVGDVELDDSGVAGGVALGYDLSNNTTIEVEYAKLPSLKEDGDDVDADMWTIGAHYRF